MKEETNMKKILTGLLALALVLTVSAPAFAAETYSTQANKTTASYTDKNGNTVTVDVKPLYWSDSTKAEKELGDSQVNTLTNGTKTWAESQSDLSGKKVNYDSPALVIDLYNGDIDGLEEWTVKISNDALADGTYVYAHLRAGGVVENGTCTVTNHSTSLTLHGASPVAFYAVSDNAAAASATAAASVAKTGEKAHKTGESLFAW